MNTMTRDTNFVNQTSVYAVRLMSTQESHLHMSFIGLFRQLDHAESLVL